MIKFFSELLTSTTIISIFSDETILQVFTEFKNLLIVVAVRAVWAVCEWLYRRIFKIRGNETR